ncbi:hypothetical protein [Actinomadura craniellae]|nr:hypothetical protein [Actinomadura craniellae]
MSSNDRPPARKRGLALALRGSAVALAAAITLGGVTGVAEARPPSCAGILKSMNAAYFAYRHYQAGGHHAEAAWWYGVYQDSLSNYVDTCIFA